jgi:uncharacterized protein (DUF169 family)
MSTYLEKALNLRFPPLAIFYAKELPSDAKLPKLGCSMLLITLAANGETVALSHDSCACHGAASGFGLAPLTYDDFPGGAEAGLRFLSTGNKDWELGQACIKMLKEANAPKIFIEEYAEGEGFFKTPELASKWSSNFPMNEPEGPFVVIKPLKDIKPGETPKVVSFLADQDQLSALVVLANFARHGADNVRIPFGPGCGSFGRLPFDEAGKETPLAVIGLTDISARFYVRKILGKDILSFTVPFGMFEEMESNAPESFLTRHAWKSIMNQNQADSKTRQ